MRSPHRSSRSRSSPPPTASTRSTRATCRRTSRAPSSAPGRRSPTRRTCRASRTSTRASTCARPGAGAWQLLTGAAAPLRADRQRRRAPLPRRRARATSRHAIFESRLALTRRRRAAATRCSTRSTTASSRMLAPGPACPEGVAPAAPCSIAGGGATALRLTARRALRRRRARGALLAGERRLRRRVDEPDRADRALPARRPRHAEHGRRHADAGERVGEGAARPAAGGALRDGEQRRRTRLLHERRAAHGRAAARGLYLWRRTPPAPGAGHLTLIGPAAPAWPRSAPPTTGAACTSSRAAS